MHWGTFGYGMGFGGIIMILAWIALIGLTMYAASRALRSRSGTAGSVTPVDIARERYARGEITREEFERLRKDLSES